jgi:hypothetical protein
MTANLGQVVKLAIRYDRWQPDDDQCIGQVTTCVSGNKIGQMTTNVGHVATRVAVNKVEQMET